MSITTLEHAIARGACKQLFEAATGVLLRAPAPASHAPAWRSSTCSLCSTRACAG